MPSIKVFSADVLEYLRRNFRDAQWVADKAGGFIVTATGLAGLEEMKRHLRASNKPYQDRD